MVQPLPRSLVASSCVVLASCSDSPGFLTGPEGTEPLRTAMWVEHRYDGIAERSILLSTSLVPCEVPIGLEDEDTYVSLMVAACREGARHVLLVAYDGDDRWNGTWKGKTGATGPERHVAGEYYGVLESVLAYGGGLERAYYATLDRTIELGNGGHLALDSDRSRLGGDFWFPEGVGGSFTAEECASTGPDRTLVVDALVADVGAYCRDAPMVR